MEITERDLLVVTDVQNDFCPGGALPVPDGDAVIPIIHRIAGRFQYIVLTQDWHPAGHISFASSHPGRKPNDVIPTSHGEQRLWPDHCVQGTHGAEFHPALDLPQAELVLRKGYRPAMDAYSVLFENDRKTPSGFAAYCRERGFERLVFAGLAYDFCVGFSALDARRCGFAATVIRDACRAIDVSGSVAAMDAAFARDRVSVISSADLT